MKVKLISQVKKSEVVMSRCADCGEENEDDRYTNRCKECYNKRLEGVE